MTAAPSTPGNFSQAELDKFGALAQRWWDPQGPQKALHAMNPVRLGYVADRVALRDARVLDVGCGGGLLSEALAGEGAHVTAIDLAPELVKVARLHGLESGVTVDYRQQAVESLADEAPGSFDAVTCMEMLEHVPDPAAIIDACARLLRPGGRLFLSTLNRTPAAFALAIVGAEYVARLLPKGTHRYRDFIRPSELGAWLRAAGLRLDDVSGLMYEPWRNSARLIARADVNYLACARKPDGSMGPAFPRAVLFDLDGTLLDSAPDMLAAVNAMRASRGGEPMLLAELRPHVSKGARAMVQAAFPGTDGATREAWIHEFLDHYRRELGRHGAAFDGVEPMLASLEAAGCVWGIVTNKPEALAAPLLPMLGWQDRCKVLIGGDSLPARKPDPLPLRVAAERIGVEPSRCIYVGDDERDIVAARAAGMPSVVALWGYRLSEDDPFAWRGDVLVDRPGDLCNAMAWPRCND